MYVKVAPVMSSIPFFEIILLEIKRLLPILKAILAC